VKLKAPDVALEPKIGALAETVDSEAVVSPLLAGDVIGEAPKTIPLVESCVAGFPKRPVDVVESAGFEKMFEDSTGFAGVEKIEEASVFTAVEKIDDDSGFEELLGENTLEAVGAGEEKRFPAGLKGDDAELEPKREELAAVALLLPPPKTEPPTGLEAPPPNIELLVLVLEKRG